MEEKNELMKEMVGEAKERAKTDYQYRYALRDIAVLEMLFATGARVSELCQLKSDSLDLKTHTMKIFGKGSRERFIQIENKNFNKN